MTVQLELINSYLIEIRGKDRNQNGHSRTLPEIIWRIHRGDIIFVGLLSELLSLYRLYMPI